MKQSISTDSHTIKQDLKKISLSFSQNMNGDSFSRNIHKNSMITNGKLSDSVTCIELRHFIVLYLLESTLSSKQKNTIKSDMLKICLKSQFISGKNRYGFRYIATSKSDIHAHTFCRQFLCIIKERTNKKMNGKNNAGIHHHNHCHHETLRKYLDTTFAFDRLQNIH